VCMSKNFITLMTLFILLFSSSVEAMIHVVSAENFYGSVVKQIGGQYVEVENVLDNPNQDPHLFTVSPKILIMIAKADLIIYNGADYDPWMIAITSNISSNKKVLIVASLLNIKINTNPHIWYDPQTMLIFAKKITTMLIAFDPNHSAYFLHQFNQFTQDYHALFLMIQKIHTQFDKTPITATEPIFNYMSDYLGFEMFNRRFQENMMNDVTPSPSDIQAFEDSLTQHKVRLLIYNKQVDSPMTKRMLSIAREKHIPVLGVTETLPLSLTYIQWMMQQLKELEYALQNEG